MEDNIRIGTEELDVNMRNWNDSAQDRDNWKVLVNAALDL